MRWQVARERSRQGDGLAASEGGPVGRFGVIIPAEEVFWKARALLKLRSSSIRKPRQNLAQIRFYEGRQPGLGTRFVAELMACVEYVCETPHRFPIVRAPEFRRLSLKRFPFAIIFREPGDGVQIIAVTPHRRRPGYWRNWL